MQACDLLCNSSLGNTFRPDSPIMSDYASSPILNDAVSSPENHRSDNNSILQNDGASTASSIATRNHRPPRACTARAAARLQAANQQAVPERKHKSTKKEQRGEEPASPQPPQCKIVTPLVSAPLPPSQQPRWTLRLMWELASVLNFLHLFRPLLNINAEFSAEEFETALLNPNATLADIHMPLLKAIPPITRMALGRGTWITVLCRKLRDWWHWVAEGELPIVASHGAEVDVYHALDPSVRLVILKALCDIRVEQEDIRNYIDSSIKHGVHLSAFRKERIGGDSHGISYWYEDDALIGHRLYREIRKVDVKKAKVKGSQVMPSMLYHWETVATSLDEFQDVSEKLFTSKNRTEASLGKKLKIDMLPEIEKVHKRKERLLKKQHREALLLDNCLNVDGLAAGRSLRDRKRVTYTFDDYDRSISEAIKITKRKQPSPEHLIRREFIVQSEASANGKLVGPSEAPQQVSSNCQSPMSPDFDDANEEHKSEPPNRRNRRRQRPQRYSDKEFVGTVLDNDIETGSDDDIVGEAIYDDEYMQQRKQRKKFSSSSEGDEEYHLDEENADEEEEEEEEEESFSVSEDSAEPPRSKKLHGRTRRETKLRSVEELQSGLRRSKRATRNCINYRQYELSESETDSIKPEKSNASDHRSDGSDNEEYSMDSKYSDDNGVEQERRVVVGKSVEDFPTEVEKEQNQPFEKENSSPGEDESDGERKGRFLDLNELAPGSGFDDGQHSNQR